MPRSQNGWSANDRSVIHNPTVPGANVTLPGGVREGACGQVLLYVASRFHREVEHLVDGWNWGYAERPIRGGSELSNHASGTAIDLNAPRHPLGAVGTFSAAQRAAIRRILDACDGVVRWGGDYSGRKDEMHFEINAGHTAVLRVARKVAGHKPGGGGAAPGQEDDVSKADALDALREFFDKGKIREFSWDAAHIQSNFRLPQDFGMNSLVQRRVDQDTRAQAHRAVREIAGLRAAVDKLADAVGGVQKVDPTAIKRAVAEAIEEAVATVDIEFSAPADPGDAEQDGAGQ